MEKIPSFTVNHLKLLPGVYVSRIDSVENGFITTFDLRFTKPNDEPVMDTSAIHAIEHLGATYLRNMPGFSEKVIYFGPMGCRTGFYLLLKGKLNPDDIFNPLVEMTDFIISFEGCIPGASARDCGNYLDMNLSMAKYYSEKFRKEVLSDYTESRTVYPG